MTDTTILDYEGSRIRLRGAMLNLTDMWQAAGRPDNRRPADWLSLEETRRFRAHAATRRTGAADLANANADEVGICHPEADGLVAAVRGNQGGTWGHWQLALTYGRYLSPPFHLWCNTAVRAAMARQDDDPAPGLDPVREYVAREFRSLHRRLDVLDRHAADLMFLQLSAQDLLLGKRRDFSTQSQGIIGLVIAAPPYAGRCPCCVETPVLTDAGSKVAGAEYDHFYHRGLNRPELGWLVCPGCHDALTHGGYLVRFARMSAFRAFQAAVLRHQQQQRAQRRLRPSAP